MSGVERHGEPIPGPVEQARVKSRRDAEVVISESGLHASATVPVPTAGAAVVLAPGERAVLRSDVPAHHGHFIVVTQEEVVLVNGLRRHRCARPGHARPGGPPLVNQLVSVFVHRRAIGPLDKGHRFVYAVGDGNRLLGTLDASDTWTFRQDQLEAMCKVAGVGYDFEVFETVAELVAARPEWAAPDLEFEVNYPRQEDTREWASFITRVLWGVSAFGGAVSAFYLTPVGIVVRAVIGLAALVFFGLSLWAHSGWRMRRSLRRRDRRPLGGVGSSATSKGTVSCNKTSLDPN